MLLIKLLMLCQWCHCCNLGTANSREAPDEGESEHLAAVKVNSTLDRDDADEEDDHPDVGVQLDPTPGSTVDLGWYRSLGTSVAAGECRGISIVCALDGGAQPQQLHT